MPASNPAMRPVVGSLSEKIAPVEGPLVSVLVEGFHGHPFRPVDRFDEVGQGEAPLLVADPPLRVHDDRVDENEHLRRVLSDGEVHDRDAQVDADLRRREPNPRRRPAGLLHVLEQRGETRVVENLDDSVLRDESRIPVLDDFAYGHLSSGEQVDALHFSGGRGGARRLQGFPGPVKRPRGGTRGAAARGTEVA